MSPRPTQSRPPALLTTKDVAEQLQLSTRTIRRLIEAGKLPARRIGRAVRINPQDLAMLVHLSLDPPTA